MTAAVRTLLLGSLLLVAHTAPLGTVYHANVTVFSTNALVRGKLRSPPKCCVSDCPLQASLDRSAAATLICCPC